MDIATYIEGEAGDNRLLTFENVPERDESSFFDDLDERNAMNDVIVSHGSPAAALHEHVGSHLAEYQVEEPGVEDGSAKELSVYALDSIISI